MSTAARSRSSGATGTARSRPSTAGSLKLLQRLSRLQHALEQEKELSTRAEEELAQLRGVASASRQRAARCSAYEPCYLSADLLGLCARPALVSRLATRGQLGRRNTDITKQQEQVGTSCNVLGGKVYKPIARSDITWQYEQYHCSKQSPSLVDVTAMTH